MTAGRPGKYPRTDFGKRLLAARKKSGITQVEIAKALGITQHTYSQWERLETSFSPREIKIILEMLQVSADYLFEQTEDMTPLPQKSSSTSSPQKPKGKK